MATIVVHAPYPFVVTLDSNTDKKSVLDVLAEQLTVMTGPQLIGINEDDDSVVGTKTYHVVDGNHFSCFFKSFGGILYLPVKNEYTLEYVLTLFSLCGHGPVASLSLLYGGQRLAVDKTVGELDVYGNGPMFLMKARI